MNKPENNRSASGNDAKTVVFVVDDEPMLLEVARMILEPLGYQVRTFRDADLALQAFQSAKPRPALVLTDFSMHTMSGMDLIRECRRVEPRQKILLVSGTVDETIYSKSSIKPDRFLAKPYLPNQLADIVRELLNA